MQAKLWIVVGLAAMATACETVSLPQAEAPSPRAQCENAELTVYFTEASATLQPTVEPFFRYFVERIEACRAEGGDVRSITIVAYADHGARRAEAEAQMRLRAQRVREALIEAGAPADRIVTRRPRGDGPPVMGRRADVTGDLY